MTLVFDTGAFLALERNDRAMWTRLKAAESAGTTPVTHGGVVAQVWRGGGGRQALLARAMRAVQVVALDEELGRRTGELLGVARMTDAIDAAVVALAGNGDLILTSDPDDLAILVAMLGRRVDLIKV